MLIRNILRLGFSKLIVPIEGKMQAKKKGDYDIKNLKKQMQIIKHNKLNNPQAIYDQIPHRQVYRKMNTSIQAFFNKRSYTIENFNFLLSIVAQQRKTSEIQKVINLMKQVNVKPDEGTYTNIIRAWAKAGDVQKAEETFIEFKKLWRPNKFTYTSLMLAYKTRGLCEKGDQLLKEMERNQLQPDLPMYTTLINTHHKSRNLKRCWELDKIVREKGMQLDQPYVGMMMTVYASTHDAEKAVKLYDEHIKNSPDLPFIETINAYLKALSSRADYCERAINYFFMMISKGEHINISTITSALKACATLGHVKDATNIVKVMKEKNLEPDEYIYNSLFRCYAGGVSLQNVSQEAVDLFIADAWRLMEEISKKKMVNVTILNSFMLIFIQALKTEEIDGLVLPLYKKYGMEMNQFTYESLMKFLAKKDDVKGIEKMWDAQIEYIEKKKKQFLQQNNNNQQKLNNAINRGQFAPTFYSTCLHLESGIKLLDMDKIINSLKLIKQMGRYPKFSHLKYLGELKNLPVEIKAELAQYEVRFGDVQNKKKTGEPWRNKNQRKEYKDPQDR